MPESSEVRRDYPAAVRLDVVDDMHGEAIADPYRWLEDTVDERTEAWSAAQDALVDAERATWAERPALHARLVELHRIGSVGTPVWRSDHRGRIRSFDERRGSDQEHPVLSVTEPSGERRVLVDPMVVDPSGTTTLDFWVPSPEGDRVAYGMSEGGTEDSEIRVLDVETGAVIEGPIDRARFSPIAWLPGGKTYYYVRHLPFDGELGDDARFYRRIYRHDVGADPAGDVEIFGADQPRATYLGVDVSDDGRYLAVTGSRGTDARNDAWIADLAGAAEFVPLQVGVDAETFGYFDEDGAYYFATNRGAPRWRICAVDPGQPDFEHWREIVAEEPTAVISEMTRLADGSFVVVRTRHAVSEVTVHDGTSGAEIRRIDLPGVGTVTDLRYRRGTGEFWMAYTDFVTPQRILRVDAATGGVTGWAEPEGAPTTGDIRVRQVTYPSYDETTVRMFLISAGDLEDPKPTILYGYGGFNIASKPAFSPLILAWVGRGGVYAIANLRGGSEEGEAWHRAGMREHKQNVFDDFAAASDWLVDQGVTTRERLGIYGGSNGGLLVGAALTQHPAKYAAVVCSKPLLDMLRYELHGLGETWNGEYGTVADPVEFGWLRAYSPYHNVHDGTDYPAVLFTVFEGDTRVDTLHARKLAALLQHAGSGARPVLIRREIGVGHANRSVSRAADLSADHAAFLAARLG